MANMRAEEARQELEEMKKPMMCFSGKLELTDQELGRGAFGVIYKGVDPKTGMILVWLAYHVCIFILSTSKQNRLSRWSG